MKIVFGLAALFAASVVVGGCSKQPPVPDPAQVPVAQQMDSIQKDPTLSVAEKQQKMAALQNHR